MNLFVLESALGDALLTTGIIDKLKDEPSYIITTPRSVDLFQDLPNLQKILLLTKKSSKTQWFEFWWETRKHTWNHVIDFRRTGISYFLKANHKFIRQSCNQKVDDVHIVRHISRNLKSAEPLTPALWFSKERLRRIQKVLEGKPAFSVAPMANWVGKQWPLENFTALVKKFCKAYPEAKIATYAAPHERAYVAPLLDSIPKDQHVDTAGWNLLDIATLIKSSRLFLGNDSGLMHVSAAVKTPTVALFGPSDERIYGPWSDQAKSPHRVLRGKPFWGKMFQDPADTNCYMTDLKVPFVWKTVQEMWERVG